MKMFTVLCVCVLGLLPTTSLAADLPLTPQILDQIKADVEAYEERLDDPEDMNEALIGRISGLQSLIILSAMLSLAPSDRALFIEALHGHIHTPRGGVKPGSIEHKALIYTYNVMIFALYYSLLNESGTNATPETPTP
ncbi:MAG: hypothetical protein OXF97_00430 [Nitrospira sp.]|nr:hypothetical protein [Nitrospira sp.]